MQAPNHRDSRRQPTRTFARRVRQAVEWGMPRVTPRNPVKIPDIKDTSTTFLPIPRERHPCHETEVLHLRQALREVGQEHGRHLRSC